MQKKTQKWATSSHPDAHRTNKVDTLGFDLHLSHALSPRPKRNRTLLGVPVCICIPVLPVFQSMMSRIPRTSVAAWGGSPALIEDGVEALLNLP